jgi:signal transduction histidine kinase
MTLFIGIPFVFAFYVLSIPAWDSFYTNIAFQALLAFSAMLCASWIYINLREGFGRIYHLLFVAFLFRAITHLGSAITHLYDHMPASATRNSITLTMDLFEICILLILIYFTVHGDAEKYRLGRTKSSVTIYIITWLTAYGFLYYLLLPAIAEYMVVGFGTGLGLLAVTAAIRTIQIVLKEHPDLASIDHRLMLAGTAFAGMSVIPMLVSLYALPVAWLLAMCFQAASFIIFLIAFSVPILRQSEISLVQSYIIPSLLTVIVLIPFLVSILAAPLTLIVEATPNLPLYYVSTGGAFILSFVILILTYLYSRRRPRAVQYPLMLLFATWAIIQLALTIYQQPEAILQNGESIVPYVTGSIIALVLLGYSIRAISDEADRALPSNLVRRLLVWSVFVGFAIWLAELAEASTLNAGPELIAVPHARAVLLIVNLTCVLFYTLLLERILRNQKSWKSVEFVVASYLALWIAPNILKGSFLDWTIGWWGAEILLFLGLALGPAFLGYLYMDALARADDSHGRASLYSDLLIHDVGNIHHAAVLSLELAQEMPDMREVSLEQALDALQRADRIVKNVQTLVKSESHGVAHLEPIDLVSGIRRAHDQAVSETLERGVEFSLNAPPSCIIFGNELIVDLFGNLFSNSIRYSPQRKIIQVDIKEMMFEGAASWKVTVTDHGSGIAPERRSKLFRRYMTGASGSGLGLSVVHAITHMFGGSIEVSSRVESDYSRGTTFTLTFPVHEESD